MTTSRESGAGNRNRRDDGAASRRAGGQGSETQRKRVGKRVSQRLSPTDAAFIYLEGPELPLAIASLSIFDGPIPFDTFVATVQSRLDQFPRLRQVVMTPPMNLGLPTWEDDPHFDIKRHIFPDNAGESRRRSGTASPYGEISEPAPGSSQAALGSSRH